jgi:hypothetical protein
LADESVVSSLNEPSGYQLLLLSKADEPNSLSLTSKFNYLITKKRLIMMTKTTSNTKALLKMASVTVLIAGIAFLFSSRTIAQEIPQVVSADKQMESTSEGVSDDLLKEYAAIIWKYKSKSPQSSWWTAFPRLISEEDRTRMETIFKGMSRAQQEKQIVVFMQRPAPLKKVVPTTEEMKKWQNSAMYGLWINDKRVSNHELSNYTNTDFAQVMISKLMRNAINYGKHYYQINLMTKEYYDTYYQKAILEKKSMMLFKVRPMSVTKFSDIFELRTVKENEVRC